MPMYNKKAYLLFVLQILKEYTDEEHPMLQKDIVNKIKEIYGVDLDRKSIASSIETLNEFNEYDIEQIPSKGYYLASRDLDITQVQYLIDAIYSSKSITGSQAEEMVKVLSKEFLSLNQRKNYSYIYKSTEVNRSDNKNFFYNIDIINKAIEHNKNISFQYLSYDKDGKPTTMYNGYRYYVSPYYLINNFGKYYLLAKYYKGDLSTYRIDYMVSIKEEDRDRKPMSEIKAFTKGFKIYDYINDHIYMFSDELIEATLLIQKPVAIRDIIDWFGNNAKIYTKENNTYAQIKCNKPALLYWCLQYISVVKVISPSTFQEEIINVLENNLDQYKNLQ